MAVVGSRRAINLASYPDLIVDQTDEPRRPPENSISDSRPTPSSA
jgi:hypothetical protein